MVVVTAATAVSLASPAAAEEGWDPTLPKILSAGAPGDPVAVAQASLAFTQQAASATMDLGRKFLAGLGFGGGGASTAAIPGGRVSGPQAIEYVIRRGASQRGVPYSWGGGAINGPSAGVDHDAGKIGYDCSGFTRYSFAGVGVQIPKYSGDQYTAGRHVAPSQAKRGDLALKRGSLRPLAHDVPVKIEARIPQSALRPQATVELFFG
jgi:cell wall-associated NlpC family hydrolase